MKVITLTATCLVLFATTANSYYFSDHAIDLEIRQQQVECLAKAVYHEARGESTTGQIAVAYSVINRKDDRRFPNTACEVVFQPAQYSDIEKATFPSEGKEWEQSYRIAKQVYGNQVSDPTNGAKWYYNPKKVKPYWKKYAEGKIVNIGNHKFIENVRNK